MEPGYLVDFWLNVIYSECCRIEIPLDYTLYIPHLNFDILFSKLLSQLLRRFKHDECLWISLNVNTQLIPHLIKLVFAQHIELATFSHKNSKLTSITENTIIILILYSSYFLIIDLHKDFVFYHIICEIHCCFPFISFRSL